MTTRASCSTVIGFESGISDLVAFETKIRSIRLPPKASADTGFQRLGTYVHKSHCESLQEFMKILMQLVHVDHVVSEQKQLAIKEIATQLGIAQSVLDAIEDSLLSKPKDDQGSTSSSQSQHSKKDNQSTEKAETANPNHSKLVKISADLFEISGYLAKLDGRISREEIKAITDLMNEMQLEKTNVAKRKIYFTAASRHLKRV